MDFRTAQPIIDACRKKAEEGIWGYTSRPASYFEAVREWEEKRNQWNPDTRLMSWAIGVVPAMASLIKLLQKGDRILFQTPVYSEFYDITEHTGRTVAETQMTRTETGWTVDLEDFEKRQKTLRCSFSAILIILWVSSGQRKTSRR